MAKAKETQAFFDAVAKLDRATVTELHSAAIILSDKLEGEARHLTRLVQLAERVETDPNLKGRTEELQNTLRALIRETDAFEAAARSVSKIEEQLHRIVGELLPHAKAAGYKVTL